MYGLLRPRPWMRAFAFDEGHGLSVVGDLPRPDNAGSTGKADRFKVAEQVEHAVTPGSPLTEDYAVQTMYRRGGSAFQGDLFRRRHGTSIPDCRCAKKLTYAGTRASGRISSPYGARLGLWTAGNRDRRPQAQPCPIR